MVILSKKNPIYLCCHKRLHRLSLQSPPSKNRNKSKRHRYSSPVDPKDADIFRVNRLITNEDKSGYYWIYSIVKAIVFKD